LGHVGIRRKRGDWDEMLARFARGDGY
jgi:hypothetical protein